MEEDLVRMATELTRQANQMHEMQLELQRIATTTSQAEERAKVAEEKACAAVMAIGMVKAPEQKRDQAQQPRCREVLARDVHGRPRGQEELRGVLGRGRDVPECIGTWPVGETSAGVGCCFPWIVLSDVEAYEESFRLEPEGGVTGAWTPSAQSAQR